MIREVFTVKYVAALYRVSTRRIRFLSQSRGIGHKIGGKLFFTKADIRGLKPGKNGYPKGRARKIGTKVGA